MLFKRALAIREKALVPKHPDVAETRKHLMGLMESKVKNDAHLTKICIHWELVAYNIV